MLLVLAVASSPVRAQAPPPLEPPAGADEAPPAKTAAPKVKQADEPSASRPVTSESMDVKKPARATPPAATRPALRPLLVIPGVTAPDQATTPPPRPSTRPRTQPARGAGPALSGPVDPAPAAGRAGVVQSRVEPPRVLEPPIPLTIEPIEDEPAAAAREVRRPAAVPRDGSTASRSATPTPGRPPARPQGFLGRLLGIPAPEPSERKEAATPARAPSNRPASRAGAAATSDPRRALEREIVRVLGDKARSVEVRVSGKNALVVVKPTRFWQKRAIRSTLDSLPALAGYHARIDVLD